MSLIHLTFANIHAVYTALIYSIYIYSIYLDILQKSA